MEWFQECFCVRFLMPDSFIVDAWEEHDVVTAVTWNLYESERLI